MLKTAIISVSTLAFASVAAVTIATTIRDASYHVDPYQDWQLTTKGVIFDCKRPE